MRYLSKVVIDSLPVFLSGRAFLSTPVAPVLAGFAEVVEVVFTPIESGPLEASSVLVEV
jgi:hypothetical protein